MHFSRIFSIIFKFLFILLNIFEKLPRIWGLCPIVKFLSALRRIEPPKLWKTSQPNNSGCITVTGCWTTEKVINFLKLQKMHVSAVFHVFWSPVIFTCEEMRDTLGWLWCFTVNVSTLVIQKMPWVWPRCPFISLLCYHLQSFNNSFWFALEQKCII